MSQLWPRPHHSTSVLGSHCCGWTGEKSIRQESLFSIFQLDININGFRRVFCRISVGCVHNFDYIETHQWIIPTQPCAYSNTALLSNLEPIVKTKTNKQKITTLIVPSHLIMAAFHKLCQTVRRVCMTMQRLCIVIPKQDSPRGRNYRGKDENQRGDSSGNTVKISLFPEGKQ